MKKYVVELSAYGTDSKTIGYNNYQWTITQGQIIKEGALTKNFPQYFVDYVEEISEEVKEIAVSEVKTPVVEEVVAEEATPVVEEVVVVEDSTPVVEVEDTPVVEEVEVTLTDAEVLNIAKTLKTKNELDEYAKNYGVELNKQKSLKYMLTDFETALKSK